MKKFFVHNIFLKIIALGLAVITWSYVNGEILK
jgi:YbbR domain-containing protein